MRRLVLLLTALVALAAPVAAITPDEQLDDPVLEERAREISRELRCVVCQSQSIDESNATMARDLRMRVRERLVAGDSDEEVVDYVVSRYGEYVLMKPRIDGGTLVLWGAPLLFLGLGGGVLWMVMRRSLAIPIDDEDEAAPETPA